MPWKIFYGRNKIKGNSTVLFLKFLHRSVLSGRNGDRTVRKREDRRTGEPGLRQWGDRCSRRRRVQGRTLHSGFTLKKRVNCYTQRKSLLGNSQESSGRHGTTPLPRILQRRLSGETWSFTLFIWYLSFSFFCWAQIVLHQIRGSFFSNAAIAVSWVCWPAAQGTGSNVILPVSRSSNATSSTRNVVTGQSSGRVILIVLMVQPRKQTLRTVYQE